MRGETITTKLTADQVQADGPLFAVRINLSQGSRHSVQMALKLLAKQPFPLSWTHHADLAFTRHLHLRAPLRNPWLCSNYVAFMPWPLLSSFLLDGVISITEQAAESRDALAKTLYSNVFDWLVAAINRKIPSYGAGLARLTVGQEEAWRLSCAAGAAKLRTLSLEAMNELCPLQNEKVIGPALAATCWCHQPLHCCCPQAVLGRTVAAMTTQSSSKQGMRTWVDSHACVSFVPQAARRRQSAPSESWTSTASSRSRKTASSSCASTLPMSACSRTSTSTSSRYVVRTSTPPRNLKLIDWEGCP